MVKLLIETIEIWKEKLEGVNLQNANLNNAQLSKAYPREADLRKAKKLTLEQLCKASSLYEAYFDQELVGQINQGCPDLLKKAKRD